MAKLKGKAKAAFLRRMARGRAKARRGLGSSSRRSRGTVRRTARRKASFSGTLKPSRKRKGVIRIQLRQNPMSALIANPGGALVPYRPAVYYTPPGGVRRRRKRRGTTMAKRRRKRSYSRRAAPRRRRRGAARRRIRRAIRVPKRYAHRVYRPRGRRAVYLNPKRRRRVRRRRNPGMGGGSLLKRVLVPYAAGFLASGAVAILDTALSKYPVVSNIVKVGAAFAIAIGGRRYPRAATAAIAALAATQGYRLGTKVAGGFIAQSPAQAVTGLGDMSRTYPEIGALLTGGVGALLNGMGDPSNPDAVVANYAAAMDNMADDD